MHESYLLGGLLVLHRPGLMLEMCTTNLSTQQPCVTPLAHFSQVAQRLGLSQQQLSHLRLMLQQYNRSMHQQLQEGLGLLQVSRDIAGVQTAVVAAQASRESSAGSAATTAAPAAAAAAADKDAAGLGATSNAGADSSHRRRRRSSSSSSSSSSDDEVDAEGLTAQLQQHLSERMQVMQVRLRLTV
jgi:hypothetical protein